MSWLMRPSALCYPFGPGRSLGILLNQHRGVPFAIVRSFLLLVEHGLVAQAELVWRVPFAEVPCALLLCARGPPAFLPRDLLSASEFLRGSDVASASALCVKAPLLCFVALKPPPLVRPDSYCV